MIRMPLTRALTVLLLAVGAATVATAAQPVPDQEAMRERLQSMTPEQRAAAKEKMRQRWESMTPEQREAAKKRFAERHPDGGARLKQRHGTAAPAPAASTAP